MTRFLSTTTLAALLAFGLAGCFDTINGDARIASQYPSDEIADGDTTPTEDGDSAESESDADTSVPTAAGILFYMRHDADVLVPKVEQHAPGTVENLFLLEEAEGGGYVFTFCDQYTNIDNGFVPPVELHDPIKQALNKDGARLNLKLDGDALAAAKDQPWVWGLNLPDPLNTPLPALPNPDKPCPYDKAAVDPNGYEYDQDGDGHPGISIHVLKTMLNKEGERFMGERYVFDVKAGKTSTDGAWTVGAFAWVNEMSSFCSLATDGTENQSIALLAALTDKGTSQWAVYRAKGNEEMPDGDADGETSVDGDEESAIDGDTEAVVDGDTETTPECNVGAYQCQGDTIERCSMGAWIYYRDCTLDGLICKDALCVAAPVDGDNDSDVTIDGDQEIAADGDQETSADGDVENTEDAENAARKLVPLAATKMTCEDAVRYYKAGFFKNLPKLK